MSSLPIFFGEVSLHYCQPEYSDMGFWVAISRKLWEFGLTDVPDLCVCDSVCKKSLSSLLDGSLYVRCRANGLLDARSHESQLGLSLLSVPLEHVIVDNVPSTYEGQVIDICSRSPCRMGRGSVRVAH